MAIIVTVIATYDVETILLFICFVFNSNRTLLNCLTKVVPKSLIFLGNTLVKAINIKEKPTIASKGNVA